jgi:hypothetical protein
MVLHKNGILNPYTKKINHFAERHNPKKITTRKKWGIPIGYLSLLFKNNKIMKKGYICF